MTYFNPKSTEIVSFHTDTKPSGMDTVLYKYTTSIFRQPPEDASNIKLNDKHHMIFFTNTVFKVAVFCTTSVLQFLLLPQMKQERKQI